MPAPRGQAAAPTLDNLNRGAGHCDIVVEVKPGWVAAIGGNVADSVSRSVWPRGKGWGGSSSINAMIYIRGHAQRLRPVAPARQRGWGCADVLPYFKRTEDCRRRRRVARRRRPAARLDLPRPTRSEAFLEAGAEAGYPRNNDFNGDRQEGVGLLPGHAEGRRALPPPAATSAGAAPEQPHVRDRRAVNRIMFEAQARGVETSPTAGQIRDHADAR